MLASEGYHFPLENYDIILKVWLKDMAWVNPDELASKFEIEFAGSKMHQTFSLRTKSLNPIDRHMFTLWWAGILKLLGLQFLFNDWLLEFLLL